jgi:2-oxoglutarate ferredoxin oxidoreductase subunit gamma
VFEGGFDPVELRVVEIPATDLAVDLGNIMTASMVMLGAYVAATGMVSFDALDAAVAESLPPYRTQHVALNVAALAVGRDAVPRRVAPAWHEEVRA